MQYTEVNSLYIHVPFCISKCAYCDFFSVTDCFCQKNEIPQSYLTALCNEINFRKNQFNIQNLKTIYIGGGTPSLLTEKQLSELLLYLKNNFKTDGAEISIEANPDDLTEEKINSFKTCGINRISCGIQSLNEDSLKFVKRRASAKQNIEAIKLLKKSGMKFSVDLICGLPYETEKSFLQALDFVILNKPSHISMYSLTIEDETPLGKFVNNGNIDYDYDFADELWLKSKEILKKNGYFQYEVSNFALKNENQKNECLHNLVYWNHQSYAGCGSGATGTVYTDSGEGKRWTNVCDVKKYTDFWNSTEKKNAQTLVQTSEEIDLETSKFEYFMMGMRKTSGVSQNHFRSVFMQDWPLNFTDLCEKWKKKKLLEIEEVAGDKIARLNKKGLLFLNNFLENL